MVEPEVPTESPSLVSVYGIHFTAYKRSELTLIILLLEPNIITVSTRIVRLSCDVLKSFLILSSPSSLKQYYSSAYCSTYFHS